MLIKLKEHAREHRYAGLIFLFMFVYNFIVVKGFSLPEMDEITYTYHIVDFSIGFCTKLLPGAFYNAIFPTTDFNVVNLYFFILYHTFLILVAFILEKFLKNFGDNDKISAFIMVMFFITGPATFSVHTYRLGMLDTYWLFFTTLFLIAVQNKVLRWFVPVIFILSIFIHVSAMVSFVPFFALILLYEAAENRSDQKTYLCIFIISVLVAVIVFLYFITNESTNLILGLEDFRKFLALRNQSEWHEYTKYYDYALYRISYIDEKPIVQDTGVFSGLILQIKETFKSYKIGDTPYNLSAIKQIFISLPLFYIFCKSIIQKLKHKETTRFSGVVFVLMLFVLPFTFLTGILCSPDITRWFSHGFMLFFMLILYDVYKTKDKTNPVIEAFSVKRIDILSLYFIIYMLCVVDPYC